MFYFIFSVSEDEVTREASDLGVTKEKYVDDLLQVMKNSEERVEKDDKEVFSFHLAPDHRRLSYEKIGNISVRKTPW